MSSYYPSFNYMGLNSLKDKKLIVVSFDPDQGEHDTFLDMEPIYTESAHGNRRLDYGAKYSSVAVVKITVIKSDGSDFTVANVRDFLRWTTGVRQNSYLDLLVGDVIQFSFLGRVTNAYQQKLDARTVGLAIEFTSVSPWAYSPIQRASYTFDQVLSVDNGALYDEEDSTSFSIDENGVLYNNDVLNISDGGIIYIDNSSAITINNETDDLYTYIGLNTIFTNNNSDYLSIKNLTTGEETIITEMGVNEVITLSDDQFIISDIPNKIFGNTFNFTWPRLIPGVNKFLVTGSGSGRVDFSYRYPIKIGDCAIDIDTFDMDIDCDL